MENDTIRVGAIKSSYCPDYSSIPLEAMESLAKRYELGAKKYERNNWRKGLNDTQCVIERLNHVINHAFTLIAKLEGRMEWDKDDDAGGILWGGAFAATAVRTMFPKEVEDFE